ncbi:MAG TPA: DUF5060 domain-containing protein [Bacteroidales bacterium]|nr:DUF5060 domain-containing protein [Bacteroidales bacterium]
MNKIILFFSVILLLYSCSRGGTIVTGELRQWHKITLTADGPQAGESDTFPNPFLDYRMTVVFTHESDTPSYTVPGYFAADGDAANSSATSGNQWRAHFSPDKTGRWNYDITIIKGRHVAVNNSIDDAKRVLHKRGSFDITETDKTGRDFRGKGRLRYTGERYLQFSGTGEYFIKAGADSPENLLAYADFDGTSSNKKAGISRENEATTAALKTWDLHIRDWKPGDPAWKENKGKGLIGALNYLAGKGCNSFSFLTYNAGGDGDDVWPFVSHDDKLHMDCSKLDQWQIVFEHAQEQGLYAHFKLQETENDDNRLDGRASVPAALDQGDLGIERKLYFRELIARFGYLLALNWNLGEENTQTPEQQRAMAKYIHDTDPYRHHIVIHTYPDWQDRVYKPLIGDSSVLTGISLQNSWQTAHQRILYWIKESEKAGKKWVVANDEQNPHYTGVPPDSGFEGFDGIAHPEGTQPYSADEIRKYDLWGVLMAGGAGVEYYFGYTLPQNDLGCQNWRSRDKSWDYCRIALDFFNENKIPVIEMDNSDDLIGNFVNDNSKYCFSKSGEIYVIYLPDGGTTQLDLTDKTGPYSLLWYNPRTGGDLQTGSIRTIEKGGIVSTGNPPSEPDKDWVILIKRQ